MIRSVPRPAKAASRPRPLKPRLTDMEFCAWVAQAEAGDRLEYHRGFLARDTYRLDSSVDRRPKLTPCPVWCGHCPSWVWTGGWGMKRVDTIARVRREFFGKRPV